MDAESFLFASSAAVYGERKEACRETDSPNPESPYTASKLAAEYYCRVYARTYGIPVSILRFFNVLGPGQSPRHSGAVTSFLNEASQGRPPTIYGDGKQTRDFIFVEDVVEAILKTLDTKLQPGDNYEHRNRSRNHHQQFGVESSPGFGQGEYSAIVLAGQSWGR